MEMSFAMMSLRRRRFAGQGWILRGPVKRGWNIRALTRVRVLPLAVAMAAALISALAACQSGGGSPASDGPLTGGPLGSPSGGFDCAPARLGRPVTFGDEQFTNHGHATVALDRVALLDPLKERLTAAVAVPGLLFVGVTNSWPPRYSGIPRTWKYRRPVRGFRLEPGKSFNMVLGVAATGIPRARSRGMVIYYHDSAGSYVTRNQFAMIIAVNNKSSC